jgi:hypothetical protein
VAVGSVTVSEPAPAGISLGGEPDPLPRRYRAPRDARDGSPAPSGRAFHLRHLDANTQHSCRVHRGSILAGPGGRCDASGIARLFADAPGPHTIELSIAVRFGSRTFIETLGGETGIDVYDTAKPQTFHVCVPAAIIDEARSRAEALARIR